ncbi:M23 family metallopeptidase [Streptomyces sp. WAC06614]|uniref:M23 family metallopeptidase n=1 Tax=Streptomyces sp. WAC06614 TaxID=2487416 RepID=UPI0021AF538B|nr:M23 family metallopeptidase [Streptomyces sp. WAC06614]
MESLEPAGAGAWGEWNPTEDSVRPVRGRHRVAKQRGGLARSSTVLGVGVIAAVGAGGIATAQDRPQVSISLPSLPSLDALTGAEGHHGKAADADTANGAAQARGAVASHADAGEALRSRILQQAEAQTDAADAVAKSAAEQAARDAAAQEAKDKQESARKAAEEAAAKEAADARTKAEEAARAEAEAAQPAPAAPAPAPAGSFSLPTSSYTITSTYGAAGSMWSSGHHTGLDFAAPTGTPVKAVAGGTITSAGWSGAYGYRIVLELPDGTEIWYCHLSSMSVTSGAVGAGTTIGRVGATGNVTGPHLHLEVRTSGGSTMDPMAWLESKGLEV